MDYNYPSTGFIWDHDDNLKCTEWVIEDYFSRCQKADFMICSPPFHFGGASWCLRIFPNGRRSTNSVGWVNCQLRLIFSMKLDIELEYYIAIKSVDDLEEYPVEGSCNFDGYNSTTREWNLIERQELLQNRFHLTRDGSLHITFTFRLCDSESMRRAHYFELLDLSSCNAEPDECLDTADAASQTIYSYNASSLSQDFSNLLISEKESDLAIKVDNRTFRAHKLILGARSSVFAAMFSHNMKESLSGVINIEDCEPDAFQDFLSFIYTEKIEELSTKNVIQLFVLADKYNLMDLRQICLNFIKENLCVDIACEVMSIADKHDEKDLKASARELILSNIKRLLSTNQWISFMQKNSALAVEIMMAAIPDAR